MKLKELLHNIIPISVIPVLDTGIQKENAWIPVSGTGMTPGCSIEFDADIKGITCNPKRVKDGYLFVCISEEGKRCLNGMLEKYSVIQVADTGIQKEEKTWSCAGMTKIRLLSKPIYGEKFLGEAQASTAEYLNVFEERSSALTTKLPSEIKFQKKSIILHPNPRALYSEIVSRFYQFKQPKYVAAVTGTNGKTSVVEFCRQIWQNAGYSAASIGTLGTSINDEIRSNNNNLTTPSEEDLYAALREMNSKNVEHLALEASSHGIDQYRIHGLKLSAAAFTNFSQDHLDYHKNLSEYLNVKKRLFSEVLPKGETAILNADINEYSALLDIAKKQGSKIINYGKRGSDIALLKQIPTADGQHLTIKINDQIYDTFFPVFGKFQAYNLLCAIGMVISSGIAYQEIYIDKLVSPLGRMEKVSSFAFVDYAHTPDALKQALLSLKWHFNKKIVLVFGCGGNRDQTKRPEMGKVAQTYADKVIVTDDNPRNEDPAKIRHDILLHCPGAMKIGDRKEAIEYAAGIAHNEDMILLVAGKGNEKMQIIGDQIFEFSDVQVIQEYINNKRPKIIVKI